MRIWLPLRIGLWRARPVFVLAAAAGALWWVWHTLDGDPPTAPVVVAARDLAVGEPLVAADLRVARLPPGLVPDAAVADPADWLGATLAVEVPRGLPLVPGLRSGARFALEPPAGSVVVPVAVTAADLLRVGDRVDLVAAGCSTHGVLATGALVVDLGGADAVLVATDAAQAQNLVSVGDLCPLAVLLVE